ncbi:MAG: putative rane protein [Fibrobacteria bacterium]|jgi:uncharacterized membrane protein|nr:putative rane protein [Fibrobacteria bacterium]
MRKDKTQEEVNEAEWRDPASWRGGWLGLYFGKRDARLLVPKRRPGGGWTVNLARREGKALLLALLGAAVTALLVALDRAA